MMTTKRHMQGRKGRAAMELGKQRFVKQAHLEKEEREQAKFEAAWAAAKMVHERDADGRERVPYVAGGAGGGEGGGQGKGGGAAGGSEARRGGSCSAGGEKG